MKKCSIGKRRYGTERAAWRALDRCERSWKGDPIKRPRRAYFCHRCKGMHLTSKGL